MESLGCRRVIDQSHFQGVSLACFETGKFDNSRACLEYLIGANKIIDVIDCK